MAAISLFSCSVFGQDVKSFREYTKEVAETTLKEDTANLRSIEKMQREIAEKMHLKTVFKNEYAEETMLSFWDSSPEFIVIGSRHERTFIWVNQSFADYLGYDREELLQIDFFTLIKDDYLQSAVNARMEYDSTGTLQFDNGYLKNYYKHKKGYYLPVYWYETVVNGKDNYLTKAKPTM